MPWYTITTAEIAAGKPIDAELLGKMEKNVNQAMSMLRIRESIPNPSFEMATGAVPLYWTLATANGADASLATGCHGAKSLKFTKLTAGAGAAAAACDYFPLRPNTMNTLYLWAWASSTSVIGTIRLYSYDKNFTFVSVATGFNGSSFAATPTTKAVSMTSGTNAAWGRIELGLWTTSVTGTLYFDELYYPW